MHRITVIHLLAMAAATAGAQSRVTQTQHETPLATFTIQELFGVTHPDQVIDRSTENFLAHWSHQNHGGESQHILRLKSNGAYRVFIVPYAKGKRPDDFRINQVKHEVVITAAGRTAHIQADGSFRLR